MLAISLQLLSGESSLSSLTACSLGGSERSVCAASWSCRQPPSTKLLALLCAGMLVAYPLVLVHHAQLIHLQPLSPSYARFPYLNFKSVTCMCHPGISCIAGDLAARAASRCTSHSHSKLPAPQVITAAGTRPDMSCASPPTPL